MRKLAGVAMSLMMMLVACGGSQLKTFTYTSSQSVVIPAGVNNLVTMSGYGARGQDAGEYYVDQYDRYFYNNLVRRSDGGTTVTGSVYDGTYSGATPSDYCGPVTPTPGNPTYSSTQTCFTHTDTSYWQSYDATTGAAATMTGPGGFSRTFPGSTGNVAPAVTSFANVPITPGTYSVSIPSGGSITITYYE